MPNVDYPRSIRVLFDEAHSESWTVCRELAARMTPYDPEYSSYALAAEYLARGDFAIRRHTAGPLDGAPLEEADVLVILHPCDAKWEAVTSAEGSPVFSVAELRGIGEFVQRGGSLLVVTDYEYEKYGANLNELLAPFGIQIENTTVQDHVANENGVATWVRAENVDPDGLGHLVPAATFYQSGSLRGGQAVLAASASAHPARAVLLAKTTHGAGRVVVAADSVLFGDRYFAAHRQLWRNIFYWLSVPAFARRDVIIPDSVARQSDLWAGLKETVNTLRTRQLPDGAVEQANHSEARKCCEKIDGFIARLVPHFSHQAAYLNQTRFDLHRWAGEGFGKPDFGASLAAFSPQIDRTDHREHLVFFPLYTPNASKDTRFEALIIRTPWPDWLAAMEAVSYRNDKFVPGHLVDFTDGYASECAVLFPETISLKERATNNFAIIFCDREAARLQRYTQKAAVFTSLALHPQLEAFLGSLALLRDTTGLWDLIHDKSHSLGELPFDPFMIRQRAPFWMYALEELRVDLRSFGEAERLAAEGFPFAHYVTYAVLFDRIFRFAISGDRVRNYDALGGQLLFSFLHQKDILLWRDNRLTIRWDLLSGGVRELRDELGRLYHRGADCSKMNFWIAAHNLISQYVAPNVGSKWKHGTREICDEENPKKWIDLVHPDEFPLGNFHTNLQRKMRAALA